MLAPMLLTVIACTGGDGDSDVVVLTSGDATVSIPAGATPEGVEVTVTQDDPGVDAPDGNEWAGDIFAFTPHGTEFSSPVTITLPYTDAGEEHVLLRLDDSSDTTWEAVAGATWNTDTVTFETLQFSFYGPAAVAASDSGDTADTADTSSPVVTDVDGDGFDGEAHGGSDCDDNNPGIWPGAPEYCNGVDDDCDGVVDETPVDGSTWYQDADGDGFGNDSITVKACSQPAGYVSTGGDCNDSDSAIYPGSGC